MNDEQKNIELPDENEPTNADSVSDPGEEQQADGVYETETIEQPDDGLSSLSGEAELKPRAEFPPDDRY
jgi:hypothetical protein